MNYGKYHSYNNCLNSAYVGRHALVVFLYQTTVGFMFISFLIIRDF